MKILNHLIIFLFKFRILYTFQHIINVNHIRNKIKEKYSLHKNLGYNKSRKILFNQLNDNIIYGHKNSIKNIKQLNCEHIWCQKYFDYKEPMKSDLHIMYISNSKLNSHRQDYKFSDIKSNFVIINNNGTIIDKNIFNQFLNNHLYKKNSKKKIFEPAIKSKGKISRSIAYYHLIYNDINENINEHEKYNLNLDKIIDNKYLLEWNRKYLPKIDEIQRNEIIRLNQENINPFIKYPILLEILYNEQINSKYIIKLGFYTIFTIILSDLFKFNYKLKKNIAYF